MSYKFMFALRIIFGKISVVDDTNASEKRINIFPYSVVADFHACLSIFSTI